VSSKEACGVETGSQHLGSTEYAVVLRSPYEIVLRVIAGFAAMRAASRSPGCYRRFQCAGCGEDFTLKDNKKQEGIRSFLAEVERCKRRCFTQHQETGDVQKQSWRRSGSADARQNDRETSVTNLLRGRFAGARICRPGPCKMAATVGAWLGVRPLRRLLRYHFGVLRFLAPAALCRGSPRDLRGAAGGLASLYARSLILLSGGRIWRKRRAGRGSDRRSFNTSIESVLIQNKLNLLLLCNPVFVEP
jgi:hypothetical protein